MGLFHYISELVQPAEYYIGVPRHKLVMPLIGETSSRITIFARDICKIDFEVDKYIDEMAYEKYCKLLTSNKEYLNTNEGLALLAINNKSSYNNLYLNPAYEYLISSAEILLPEVGWFRIDEEPDEHESSDGRIYKSFSAYGYETVLQDIDLINFYVNSGIDISIEMFPENINALGLPIRNVRFFIDDPSDDPTSADYFGLGLLNVLEKEFLVNKGWSIGHVDISLKAKSGRKFQIDNSNVFAFLTQDIGPAYECTIVFDRLNMKINFYDLSNIGTMIPMEAAHDNIINNISIKSKNTSIWTGFRVQGANEQTTITYYNFGSDIIYNFDYVINSPLVSYDLRNKWVKYQQYQNSKRDEYANTHIESLRLQEKIDDLNNRTPVSEIATQWSLLTLDELKADLETYQNILQLLINRNTVNGILQIEETSDYSLYLSIKDVIIPDINNWIQYRESGGNEPTSSNYQTNWDLYGIVELSNKKTVYENNIQVLTEQGYNVPWEEADQGRKGVTEEGHNRQYELYLQYKKYVDEITAKLNTLNQKLEEYKSQQDYWTNLRKTISNDVSIENESFGFTAEDLETINTLIRISDYTDDYIEVQDTDSLETIIDRSKELYESAVNQLEVECRPQTVYSGEFDNVYLIPEYQSIIDSFDVWNFLLLELDGKQKTKQRIISISCELTDLSDTNLNIEFSDSTFKFGEYNDWQYLLDSTASSNKNSIQKEVSDYLNGSVSSISKDIWNQILAGSGSGGNIFIDNLSPSDVQKLADILSGLLSGSLTLDELEVKLAQIDHLDANSAFIKYLNAQYLVANQGDFNELSAKVALIDDLLAGTVSAELGHIINLTAENVTISEAVIKNLIAAKISVSDLQAGNIVLGGNMQILSENGKMIMNGSALQILGKTSDNSPYVAIQLGYDASNNPSLIIRNEKGAIMLDADGLHPDIVPDGLIRDNMISDNTISEQKLSFSAVSKNPDGSITVADVFIDGKGIKQEFVTINDNITGVSQTVDALQTSITNKVWQTDISNSINEYDGTTIKTIRDQVSTNTQDISGLTTTVSDVESTFNENFQSLNEEISQVKQDADQFQITVSQTYATKNELGDFSESVSSEYTQLSDKISWVVKSGTSASDFTITDRTATLVAAQINLKGLVTFSGLNTDVQDKFVSLEQSIAGANDWITSNGTNLDNLRDMVLTWTDGAVSTSTYIQGGWIATNTITSEKIAVGDFTNYAQLNEYTASDYGWDIVQDPDDSNNPWFQKKVLVRDSKISRSFDCNGGESFRVKGEISSSVKGATTNGGTDSVPLGFAISIFTVNADGTRSYYHSSRITNTSGTISSTITLPSTARSFAVYIQCGGWPPMTGTLKVRNVQVTRMASGELIVDGSITADKITTSNIVGTNGWINLHSGTFNYGNGDLVWDGSVLSVSGKITSTTGTIGGFTIGSSYLANGTTSLGTGSSAVYVGTNGISCGTKFKVTNAGVVSASSINMTGTFSAKTTNGEVRITPGNFAFYRKNIKKMELIGYETSTYDSALMRITGTYSKMTLTGDSIEFNGNNGNYRSYMQSSASGVYMSVTNLDVTSRINADTIKAGLVTRSGGNRIYIDWRTGSDGAWHLYFYVDNSLIYEW